jgi:hypothetical protein
LRRAYGKVCDFLRREAFAAGLVSAGKPESGRMTMARGELLMALGLSAAVLTTCGAAGGGGSPANLSSAPGQSALSAYVQASHRTTLWAKDGARNSYTLEISSVPKTRATAFNGVAPAYSAVLTISITKNGAPLVSSVATNYFLLNPYVPLGQVLGTGTPYAVVTSSIPVPTTFNVGTSGPAENLTFYHDSTKTVVDAKAKATYTVAANNSTTVLLCVDTVVSNVTAQGTADGLANAAETDCYSVTASGHARLVSVTLAVNGKTLRFQ